MKKGNVLFCLLVSIFFSIALLGCLHYEQTVKLNKNGSGSMKIHYWTAESNVMSITKLSFDENEIKNEQYKPLDVKSVTISNDETDSTKHVYVELNFKDINQLDTIKGFVGNSIKFFQEGDYLKLVHIVKQDSVAGSFGMDEYVLRYTYEFPSSPMEVDSFGVVQGKVVTWDYKYSDLAKTDIIMTASIKNTPSKIGLIIVAIVAVGIISYIFYIRKIVKQRKAKKEL
jgi:uncharacterized lipoprotein YehR (DUF1307 family)